MGKRKVRVYKQGGQPCFECGGTMEHGGNYTPQNDVVIAYQDWSKSRNKKKTGGPSVAEQNMGINEVGGEKLGMFKNHIASNLADVMAQQEMQGSQEDMMMAAQALQQQQMQQQQIAQFGGGSYGTLTGGPSMEHFGITGGNPMDNMFAQQAKQRRSNRNDAFSNFFGTGLDAAINYGQASNEAPWKVTQRGLKDKEGFNTFQEAFNKEQENMGSQNMDWTKWETMAKNFSQQPKLQYGGYPQFAYGGIPSYDEFGGAYYGQPYDEFAYGGGNYFYPNYQPGGANGPSYEPGPGQNIVGIGPSANRYAPVGPGYAPVGPGSDPGSHWYGNWGHSPNQFTNNYSPYGSFVGGPNMQGRYMGPGVDPDPNRQRNTTGPSEDPDPNRQSNVADDTQELAKADAEKVTKDGTGGKKTGTKSGSKKVVDTKGNVVHIDEDDDGTTTTAGTDATTAGTTQQQQASGQGAIGVGPGGAFFSLPEGSQYKNIKMKKNLFGPGYRKIKVNFRDTGAPGAPGTAQGQQGQQGQLMQRSQQEQAFQNQKRPEFTTREEEINYMEAEAEARQNDLDNAALQSNTHRIIGNADLNRQRENDASALEQSQVRRDLGVGREGRYLNRVGKLDDRIAGDNEGRARRAQRRRNQIMSDPNTPLAFQAYGGVPMEYQDGGSSLFDQGMQLAQANAAQQQGQNPFYPDYQPGGMIKFKKDFQPGFGAEMASNVMQPGLGFLAGIGDIRQQGTDDFAFAKNRGVEGVGTANRFDDQGTYGVNSGRGFDDRMVPVQFAQYGDSVGGPGMNERYLANDQNFDLPDTPENRERYAAAFNLDRPNTYGGYRYTPSERRDMAINDYERQKMENASLQAPGFETHPWRGDSRGQGNMFYPSQMGPSSAPINQYGGSQYKEGGVVYMTPAEEAAFLRNGGEFEYID